jgi:hypothetical protein
MKSFALLSLLTISLLIGCKSYPTGPVQDTLTESIDYSKLTHWAAHPDKSDLSDKSPKNRDISQKVEDVDVFFIHPTTYTQNKGELQWNANIDDSELNKLTDETTILFQASAFNQAGRVYAPRYRQAHLQAFYTDDRILGEKALDFAYQDVKDAFEYYLKNVNRGRPIIIAAHSQGTRHAKILLAEFFDGKALSNQLVAAYIIGIPVLKNQFKDIPPCENADDLQCFITWRTYKKDKTPKNLPTGDMIAVTNPLSWTTDMKYVDKMANQGAVLRDFDKVFDNLVDAQIENGILWVHKPKFPFSFLFTRDNYHVADINFFYFNVRTNAAHRSSLFLQKNNKEGVGQ